MNNYVQNLTFSSYSALPKLGSLSKVCPKCKEVRNVDYFYRNASEKKGRSYYCISCDKNSATARDKRGKRSLKSVDHKHTSDNATLKIESELARELKEVWE